jgi:two-component system, NarL family, sensor histidine kinase UhpB
MIDNRLSAAALAQELHDGVAQSLSAVNLMLQSLLEQADYPQAQTRAHLAKAHLTSRTANAELRQVIDQLRKPTASTSLGEREPTAKSSLKPLSPGSQKLVAIDRLARLGLIAALKEYFEYASGTQTQLSFEHGHYHKQLLETEVELFRITQEAVSNAVRHGRAKSISIKLNLQANQVSLLIEDDGLGAQVHAQSGVGVASMRERTARLGGALELGASASGGVRLCLWVPAQQVQPTLARQER